MAMNEKALFTQYLKDLADVTLRGDAREESYYAALERLLQGLAERRRRIAELLASHAQVFRTQSDTNQQNNQSVRAGPAVSPESSRPSRSPVPVPFGIPVQPRKAATATIGG